MVRADLHIHTVLSPCGDLEMTPSAIICRAKEQGIGIVGITDHNSTRHCAEAVSIGKREGVYVLCGAEINTKEEVHALIFVDGDQALESLQRFIDDNLSDIPNNPDIFGYQLVVDQDENVVYEEPRLLISALNRSIEEVGEFARSIGAIFIPAHIDKPVNSLLSQLGFVPGGLEYDALELSAHCDPKQFITDNPSLASQVFIRSSDAHYLEEIGRATISLNITDVSFMTIKEALVSL